MAQQKALLRRSDGFTLVEVIVVLVVLAILAVVLIPSLTGWIDRSKNSAALSGCRSAVIAAQTLASEQYGGGVAPTEAEVASLSQLKGTVSGLEIKAGQLLHLSYAEDQIIVTYCRHPDVCALHGQMYTFSAPPEYPAYTAATVYNKGDTVAYQGKILQYMLDTPLSGKQPGLTANKSAWRVMGFEEGADNSYDSQYRYNAGVVVTSSGGKSYRRRDYNLNASSVLTNTAYWELLP